MRLPVALMVGISASVAALAGASSQAADAAAPKGPACVRSGDGARVHRFKAADGVRLLGVSMGRGPVGVVMAHERGASLCNWMPFARTLKARYRVLAFDFRGSGLSGTPAYPKSIRHERDVAAAAKLLRSLGAREIVLAGASMGGTAASVAAASMRPAPAAIVNLSSPAQYIDLDAEKAVARIDVPILLVAAADDDPFVDEMRKVHASARSDRKQLEIVPGAAHATGLLQTSSVRALVTSFIAATARST